MPSRVVVARVLTAKSLVFIRFDALMAGGRDI